MNEYFCPKCNSPLRISNHIILKGKPSDSDVFGNLILFEPILGDFKVTSHPSCQMKEGVRMEFFCPVCNANLSADNDHLAHINMTDTEGDNYEIWFSEISGEQATFKIKAGQIAVKYGADSHKYTNHWGSGPNY